MENLENVVVSTQVSSGAAGTDTRLILFLVGF